MKDQTEIAREKFNEGYDAYIEGKNKDDNPYTSSHGEAWKAGFEMAQEIEGREGKVVEL